MAESQTADRGEIVCLVEVHEELKKVDVAARRSCCRVLPESVRLITAAYAAVLIDSYSVLAVVSLSRIEEFKHELDLSYHGDSFFAFENLFVTSDTHIVLSILSSVILRIFLPVVVCATNRKFLIRRSCNRHSFRRSDIIALSRFWGRVE